MSNLVLIGFVNDYKGKKCELHLGKDIEHVNELPLESVVFKNLPRKDVFSYLREIENNSYQKTLILLLSGHGEFDNGNNAEIFISNDSKRIYVADILKFLHNFKRIICIVDTCQVNRPKTGVVKLEILKNSELMLICPCSKGDFGYCSRDYGSFLFYSIYQVILNVLSKISYVNTNDLMNMFYSGIKNYIDWRNSSPKVYFNSLFRKKYQLYVELFKKLTRQSMLTIVVTRRNNNEIENRRNKTQYIRRKRQISYELYKKSGSKKYLVKYNKYTNLLSNEPNENDKMIIS